MLTRDRDLLRRRRCATGMRSTRRRTRSATAWPKAGGQLGRMMANSSPPKRATRSIGRTLSSSAVATAWSTWSPAAWPWVSLTRLKWSMSSISSSAGSPAARHAVDLARQRQLEAAPVGQPGQRVAAGQVAPARRSAPAARPSLPGVAGAAGRGPPARSSCSACSSCKRMGSRRRGCAGRVRRAPGAGSHACHESIGAASLAAPCAADQLDEALEPPVRRLAARGAAGTAPAGRSGSRSRARWASTALQVALDQAAPLGLRQRRRRCADSGRPVRSVKRASSKPSRRRSALSMNSNGSSRARHLVVVATPPGRPAPAPCRRAGSRQRTWRTHAVREAQLAVRAGADAQVVAELPVVQVVRAAVAGAREGRDLVALQPGGGGALGDAGPACRWPGRRRAAPAAALREHACSARASGGRSTGAAAANASAVSQVGLAAAASVWPGSAYIRSRLKVSKASRASSTAARACARRARGRCACSCASSKLCTPIDSRVTPAARKARKRSRSKVPGLASSVISQPGSSGRRARMSASSRSMPSGENRLGVPPPMKTLSTRRPQTSGSAASRSATQRVEVARLGQAAPPSGSWRVEVAVRALLQAPRQVHVQRQRRQRAAAAACRGAGSARPTVARRSALSAPGLAHQRAASARAASARWLWRVLQRRRRSSATRGAERGDEHQRVVAEAAARRAARRRISPCQRPTATSGSGSSAWRSATSVLTKRARRSACALQPLQQQRVVGGVLRAALRLAVGRAGSATPA